MNAIQKMVKAEDMYKPGTENIFEIVMRGWWNENAHSNVLAWLLDASGSHELGGAFIQALLRAIEPYDEHYDDDDWEDDKFVNMVAKNDPDFKSFSVQREVSFSDKDGNGRIDILLVSETAKCVICIENKVFSSEHSDQLARYADYLQEKYSSKDSPYNFFFIYLTPGGETASDSRWTRLDYNFLHDYMIDVAFPDIGAGMGEGKLSAFLEDYLCSAHKVGSFGARSRRSFDVFISEIEERIKEDFPTLDISLAPGKFNEHLTDSALTRFAPADEPGGYANLNDLVFIDIKFELEQREKGVLACVLVFTNHPKNLAEGSEFRKTFNPKSLKFRWYEAIKIEEPLLKEGESVEDFFDLEEEGIERMYEAVKKLLTRMNDCLVERKLKTK